MSDPYEFIKNHYPLDEKWTLLSDPPTFETFLDLTPPR